MEVNKLYVLKANILVYSIGLQSNITFVDDVIIRITSKSYENKFAFAQVQTKIYNLCLSAAMNKDMSSYITKGRDEILITDNDLIEYES